MAKKEAAPAADGQPAGKSKLKLIMLIVVAVFLPFVLLYTAWVYKVLWGRSTTEALKTNPDLY